jgi:hypothetical protein
MRATQVELTLFRGDGGKCRYKLVNLLAPAVRAGYTRLFNIRHVNRLSELPGNEIRIET